MASGIINLTSNNSKLESRIVWNSFSNGSSANTSNVYAELQVRRTDGYTTTGTWTGSLYIHDEQQDYSVHNSVGSDWVTLKSFTKYNVPHNDNGTGSCHIWGNVTGPSGTSLSSAYAEVDTWVTLDTIPRYLNIIGFSVKSKTINTAVISWSVSDPRNSTYYSLNGGNWIGSSTDGESVASDQKSGTFNIKNLSPNTTYKLKIKCTRADSGLETVSNEISFTTYDYAKLSSVPNVNIGSSHTITWTNPAGATTSLKLCKTDNNTIIDYGTVTGTSKSITPAASTIYALTPNSNTYTARYILTTTQNGVSYTNYKDFTFTVTNSNPVVNGFSYKDSDASIVNITEDNQRIVRNMSNLQFIVEAATAKNSATISKYEITFNNVTKTATSNGTIDFGKINASNNLTATIKVIDSRGNSSSKNIKVIIDDWVVPSAIIKLVRLNNYEDETYLTIDGQYSSVNGKNSMTIQYQYKRSDATSYSSLTTIEDNKKQTLSLSKEYSWNFKIIISDKFGSSTYNIILQKGMPILFIDTLNLNIGINMFPDPSGAKFQITGGLTVDGCDFIGYEVVDEW